MPSKGNDDAFGQFDPLLTEAGHASSPWLKNRYVPDVDLLRRLLTIPIRQGDKQESGRPAKALDSWIAHELRRSGFNPDAVWPRTRRPRVLPEGLHVLESKLDILSAQLEFTEQHDGRRLKPAALRRAIRDVLDAGLGSHEAYILGDFYAKQIDVGLSSWRRGPDILVSTKTMFSAYRKNLKNRHEEAVGEVSSLRHRHPMAAMGYVYLVRSNIFQEEGAYAILVDILTRLRRPGEAFDATMLLVADWDESADEPEVTDIDQPSDRLTAAAFFQELLEAALSRTPVGEHQKARLRRDGRPIGGLPDEADVDVDSDPE
jgi:hypothetical protein